MSWERWWPGECRRGRGRPRHTFHQDCILSSEVSHAIRITGTTMPVLEFALEPNESIISEAGELSWMGNSIQMTTHTQFGGGGGLFGVLKRVAGGGSIFMTEYRAIGGRRANWLSPPSFPATSFPSKFPPGTNI